MVGVHWLLGAPDGFGLVPTVENSTVYLGYLLSASSLKTSYEAVVMGVEGAKGPAFSDHEQSGHSDTAGGAPLEASAPADMTTLVARLICSAPYFVVYLSEILDRNHKVHFPRPDGLCGPDGLCDMAKLRQPCMCD